MAETYRIKSSDGSPVEISGDVAKQFGVIRTMLDAGVDATGDIPLPNIKDSVLKKVLVWTEQHKTDPVSEEEDDCYRTDDIPEWDKEFLKVEKEMLFDLIMAANYLEIKSLLKACSKTIANMLKGKSVERIRAEFGIQNDFTPEEEEIVRKENEWCEDREGKN